MKIITKVTMLFLFAFCLPTFVVNAYAFTLKDATSFDPQPVVVRAANTAVPVGTVIVWTREEIPDGWLECNGQAVNENLYPDLFALMSKTPNYQGMFLRGAGSQSFTQNNGSNVGETLTKYRSGDLGKIQGDSIRNIEGWFHVDNQSPFSDGVFVNESTIGNDYNASGWEGVWKMKFDVSRVTPTSNEIRPVNIAVKYIIKAE